MAKSIGGAIGRWAFLIGVLLAIILGIFPQNSPNWIIALVVIGLLVGLLNIAAKEVSPFLMAGAVLIIASALGQTSLGVIPVLSSILSTLLTIFVPATIIVAIKSVFSLAKN